MNKAKTKDGQTEFSNLAEKMSKHLKKKPGAAIVGLFLTVTFLVLISTSSVLFQFMRCEPFTVPEEDGGGTYTFVMQDFSLNCDSTRYATYLPFCYLQMLIYPLGIPLLYSVILSQSSHILSNAQAMEEEMRHGFPMTGHLRFLVKSYKPEQCFFEVIECFRKVALGSIIGIVDPSSVLAPVIGLLISLFAIYVFVGYKPYKQQKDNNVGIVLAFSLAFIFMCALIIKVGALSELTESFQQLFGYCLIGSVFAGPLAAVPVKMIFNQVVRFGSIAVRYLCYLYMCIMTARETRAVADAQKKDGTDDKEKTTNDSKEAPKDSEGDKKGADSNVNAGNALAATSAVANSKGATEKRRANESDARSARSSRSATDSSDSGDHDDSSDSSDSDSSGSYESGSDTSSDSDDDDAAGQNANSASAERPGSEEMKDERKSSAAGQAAGFRKPVENVSYKAFSKAGSKADLALRPPTAHAFVALPPDFTLAALLESAGLRSYRTDFEDYGVETVNAKRNVVDVNVYCTYILKATILCVLLCLLHDCVLKFLSLSYL
jgi:hypothetical protein